MPTIWDLKDQFQDVQLQIAQAGKDIDAVLRRIEKYDKDHNGDIEQASINELRRIGRLILDQFDRLKDLRKQLRRRQPYEQVLGDLASNRAMPELEGTQYRADLATMAHDAMLVFTGADEEFVQQVVDAMAECRRTMNTLRNMHQYAANNLNVV